MSSESYSEDDTADQQRVGLITNMEARADHQMSRRFRLFYGLSTGLGLALIVLVISWISTYCNGFGISKPDIEFNWHPMLMVLGLVFTYSQSMLVYRNARNAKKKILKIWHAVLHCLAFILSVLALKAAFDSHNYSKPPKPNLYTLHSWIGLITIILFAYQFAAGFVAFLFPGLSKGIRSIYLPIHTHFGAIIFMMVIVTAMMGFSEKAMWHVVNYSDLPGEGVLLNCIGVLLVSFGALTLYLVTDPAYKRVAIPEDEITLTGQN